MNKKIRAVIIKIAGVVGASISATSVVFFAGIQSLGWLIFLSFMAGTLGHFLFTGLAILFLNFVKQRMPGQPGKSVYGFRELPREEEVSAGGKGRTLAQLYQAGYPVPDGFILLPIAFGGDEVTPLAWEKVETRLAHLRRGDGRVSFAVRSSALNEDSAQASFAGEFESVLDVRTDDEIRDAIRTVCQSRHTARVHAYSRAQNLDAADHKIAVIIQRLIKADFSGVLFTADPLTGNLMQMTGNFVQGLGDKLVSGQTSPLTFTYQRPQGNYSGPSELNPISRELYQNANDIEKELGSPQDIEWTVSGKRLYILQSRPITTLRGFFPITGEWNDTLKGNFLWSGTNLMEACPEVLTPFTASLRPYMEDRGGPSLSVRNYPLNGIIGGRFYANISVQVSAFLPMFGGDAHRAYCELAGWWGDIPEDLGIPLIPLTNKEWFYEIFPVLLRTNGQFARYRKRAPGYVANNQRKCSEIKQLIQNIQMNGDLAALWREKIFPLYRDSIYYIVASSSDVQVRLEKELQTLVGTEDANILLSNLGGQSFRLESLGPMVGLGSVLRGEMSRETYLETYGHRGENECECAWSRPAEDPAWMERQLVEFARAPVDIEHLLARQRAAYQDAWKRFCLQHPNKIHPYQRKIEKTARAARQRESVRSEGTRVISVVRAFALRAGEMVGVGQDVFYLTIEEVLAMLAGNLTAQTLIPRRKEIHDRYSSLPPYPAIICGRFDPFAWAANPNRHSDIYDSRVLPGISPDAAGAIIKGFPGALGIVEGSVRRLDRTEDSEQLQPGEVLVTKMTNIGWTPLFPRAAAIITDLGAPLSHAAIVARELGIPAVVGCGDATTRMKTGDRVRVDGGKGVVEILQG